MCVCTYICHTYIHAYIHTYPQTELRPGNWLAGWLAELRPGSLSCAWLAGWLGGWLVGCLRPREAQRGPERRSMDRTSLSCAWLEAPHKQIYNQGGSPQIFVHTYICVEPKRMPPRTTTTFIGFQTEIHVKLRPPTSRIRTREVPHPQNYDQRGSPQAELRAGSLQTTHKQNYVQGAG